MVHNKESDLINPMYGLIMTCIEKKKKVKTNKEKVATKKKKRTRMSQGVGIHSDKRKGKEGVIGWEAIA